MIKWLKEFLRFDAPPRKDRHGNTICYCGNKIFGASYGVILVEVTCSKCGHWWLEV